MRPKFTSETARAAGKIGGTARAQALSPLRRSMIGARAAQARWYPVHASNAERIESCLRRLASIVAQAMKENEPDRAIRALAVMVPYERMRLALPAQDRGQRGLSHELSERIRGALLGTGDPTDPAREALPGPAPCGAEDRRLNSSEPEIEVGFELEDEKP
jgi:hypothetical protein